MKCESEEPSHETFTSLLLLWTSYGYGFSGFYIPAKECRQRSWDLYICPKAPSWWTGPMGWLLIFPIQQNGYMRQPWGRDGAYIFIFFPDKNILDNDIPNHKKVSWSTWFLPLTGLKYRVCALYGGFKRIFCHHCIKKFAETISHTK